MARKKTVGELVTLVTAKTAPFTRGMKGVKRTTKDTSDQMRKSSKGVDAFGAGLKRAAVQATATAAAFLGLRSVIGGIREEMDRLDVVAKAARRLGIAAEELQKLQHVAGQTAGVEAATLNTALQRLTKRISQAAAGIGDARSAFDELGLSAQRLNAMSPDQAFLELADAISKVKNPSDQLRLTIKLLDSEGGALVNMLREGSVAIEQLGGELEKRGGIVSSEDLTKIEKANDDLDNLNKSFQSLKQTLTVELAPALSEFVKQLEGVSRIGFEMSKKQNFDFVKDRFKTAGRDLLQHIVPANEFLPFNNDRLFNFGGGKMTTDQLAQSHQNNTVRSVVDDVTGTPGRSSAILLAEERDRARRQQTPFEIPGMPDFSQMRVGSAAKDLAREFVRSMAIESGKGKFENIGSMFGGIGNRFGDRFARDFAMEQNKIQNVELGANTAVQKGSAEALAIEARRNRPEMRVQERQLEELKQIANGISTLVGGGERSVKSLAGPFEGLF